MTDQDIMKEYKELKAKAELAKAKRAEGYQARKITRNAYKAFFQSRATAQEKKALEDKLASL